jgi:hypothetical protein
MEPGPANAARGDLMVLKPNSVQEKLEQIAACVCAQIEVDGLPATCFCGILPGAEVALDYAGDCADGVCGMAWVRLIGVYPSSVIGTPSEQPGNCSHLIGMDVELGIVRCASMPDDEGNPPAPADLQADAALQVADAMALRKAATCCAPERDFILGAYIPVGPAGGLVGGFWTLSLQVV